MIRGSGLQVPETGFPVPAGKGAGGRPAAVAIPARGVPGFTLIEILIVITLIGILITLAQPTFQRAVTAAKEATLKENLFVLRDLLDQYYADHGKYPPTLQALVDEHYLRRIPKDPITGSSETWLLVYSQEDPGQTGGQQESGVYDVKSGSDTVALDGSRYNDW